MNINQHQTKEDHIKAIRKQLKEVEELLNNLGEHLRESDLHGCRRLIGEAISEISPF